MSVPSSRAIWNRVRSSARRVSSKRAPIFGRLGSSFLYAMAAHSRRLLQNQLRGLAFHAAGLSGPLGSGWSAYDPGPGARAGKPTLPRSAPACEPAVLSLVAMPLHRGAATGVNIFDCVFDRAIAFPFEVPTQELLF